MVTAPHHRPLQLPLAGGGFDDFEPDAATLRALGEIYKPVKVAMRELGLSKHTIYELIRAGDIAERVPGAGLHRSGGYQRRDSRGRRIGFSKQVRMADVWRLKHGAQWARIVIREYQATAQQRRGLGMN